MGCLVYPNLLHANSCAQDYFIVNINVIAELKEEEESFCPPLKSSEN